MHFIIGLILVSGLLGFVFSPKGSDLQTIIRRGFLSLLGLLVLAIIVGGIWYLIDKTQKEISDKKELDSQEQVTQNEPNDNLKLIKIKPQQLYGKWKATNAFMTFLPNGYLQIKWLSNGNVQEGTWEIDEGILFTRIKNGFNQGYEIFEFKGLTFKFRSTDGKNNVYEAIKIN